MNDNLTNVPKILLIYTGGTIGMVMDYQTNALKAFNFDKILEKIPELNQLNCQVETVSFEEPIDSSNMNVSYYLNIVEIIEENYQNFDGFVVLTGSDTMAYASSAVSFMLENLQKPVIFTGSQLPIGDLRTDAKENLITSIEIASFQEDHKPVIQEVGLYFEYKLYRANRTTKINAEQFQAFDSPNLPPLAESGVRLFFNKSILMTSNDTELKVRKTLCTDIVIVKLFPGLSPLTLEYMLKIPKLRGVVLETYGAGNAPTRERFVSYLDEAIKRGLHIVNVTQCAGGSVLQGRYETSVKLKEIGVIDGRDITTEAAVAKLMYLLGVDLPRDEFRMYFETPLRGEMSL